MCLLCFVFFSVCMYAELDLYKDRKPHPIIIVSHILKSAYSNIMPI